MSTSTCFDYLYPQLAKLWTRKLALRAQISSHDSMLDEARSKQQYIKRLRYELDYLKFRKLDLESSITDIEPTDELTERLRSLDAQIMTTSRNLTRFCVGYSPRLLDISDQLRCMLAEIEAQRRDLKEHIRSTSSDLV